jgi:hypothetical protein
MIRKKIKYLSLFVLIILLNSCAWHKTKNVIDFRNTEKFSFGMKEEVFLENIGAPILRDTIKAKDGKIYTYMFHYINTYKFAGQYTLSLTLFQEDKLVFMDEFEELLKSENEIYNIIADKAITQYIRANK